MTDVMNDHFANLTRTNREIDVDGIKIKVKAKVEDAELFLLMKKEMDSQRAKDITSIIRRMIKRANPEAKDDDIEDFIAEHYGSLMKEITILMGFASRKDFESANPKE